MISFITKLCSLPRKDLKAKINTDEMNDESKELLMKEGPKYQYGKGCLSDGIIGA